MAQEIERRFLLSGVPPLNAIAKTIEQSYLEMPSPSVSFRTRIINGSSAVITLKKGRGISRKEIENAVSLEMAQELSKECHH